jgi:hypothetical protein
MSGRAAIHRMEQSGEETAMRITVNAGGNAIVFELNDSQASRDLVAQLPMEIEVENYGGNEKIFYPPKKLNTSGTPLAKNVQPGTLAYYAPWGDVVMFYGSFHSAPGLYELGHAVQGGERIRSLGGAVRIEAGAAE